MKYLSEHHKRLLVKRARQGVQNPVRNKSSRKPIPPEHLEIPKVFDLNSNYDEAAKLLIDIRRNVFDKDSPVFLDFHKCEEFSAGAGLALAAEVERCNLKRPVIRDGVRVPTVNGNYPEDSNFTIFLEEIGFYRLLKPHGRHPQAEEQSGQIARMRTGERVAPEITSELTKFILQNENIPQELSGNLYGVLIEAMQNVKDHAYHLDYNLERRRTLRRWWMMGFSENQGEGENELIFILYDQGATVPETMPKRHGDLLRRLKFGEKDDDLIDASLKVGSTETGQSHRGLGMASMKRLIDRFGDGRLLIISRKGRYEYRPKQGDLPEHEAVTKRTLSIPLSGTYIEWTIITKK